MKKEIFRQFDNSLKSKRLIARFDFEPRDSTEKVPKGPQRNTDKSQVDPSADAIRVAGREMVAKAALPQREKPRIRVAPLSKARGAEMRADVGAAERRGAEIRAEMQTPRAPNLMDRLLARMGNEKAKVNIARYELWQARERYAKAKDTERFRILSDSARRLYRELDKELTVGGSEKTLASRYGESSFIGILKAIIGTAPSGPNDINNAIQVAELAIPKLKGVLAPEMVVEALPATYAQKPIPDVPIVTRIEEAVVMPDESPADLDRLTTKSSIKRVAEGKKLSSENYLERLLADPKDVAKRAQQTRDYLTGKRITWQNAGLDLAPYNYAPDVLLEAVKDADLVSAVVALQVKAGLSQNDDRTGQDGMLGENTYTQAVAKNIITIDATQPDVIASR